VRASARIFFCTGYAVDAAPMDGAVVFPSVVAVMKMSDNNLDFIKRLDRHYPRYSAQLSLPLDYEQTIDDGVGL
jgi:hypothetical protein